MILDTEFLISLKAGDGAARALAADLEANSVPTRVPTVVVEELYVSVGAGGKPNANARDFEALVANKPVVPLDANIARRAGVLEGQHLDSDAKPDLGPRDAVVAATGLTYNEAVVSNDEGFLDVDGLTVETY